MRYPLILLFSLLVLLLHGCRDNGKQPSVSTPAGAGGGPAQNVRINAGGVALGGRLYGRASANGVVLVPESGRGIDVWEEVARELADSGLLVLAYDYPGHGGSPPVSGSFRADALVRAAMAYLRGQGAEKLAVVGEGSGGAAALVAAATEPVSAAAAVSLDGSSGAPGESEALAALGRLDVPVLIMAALGDSRQTSAARRLYDAARDPRTQALVPGNARGADMLRGADAVAAREVLRDFLREAFEPKSARAAGS
jgi:pimeloyl-ACP methyl ester carboxylesterase